MLKNIFLILFFCQLYAGLWAMSHVQFQTSLAFPQPRFNPFLLWKLERLTKIHLASWHHSFSGFYKIFFLHYSIWFLCVDWYQLFMGLQLIISLFLSTALFPAFYSLFLLSALLLSISTSCQFMHLYNLKPAVHWHKWRESGRTIIELKEIKWGNFFVLLFVIFRY